MEQFVRKNADDRSMKPFLNMTHKFENFVLKIDLYFQQKYLFERLLPILY